MKIFSMQDFITPRRRFLECLVDDCRRNPNDRNAFQYFFLFVATIPAIGRLGSLDPSTALRLWVRISGSRTTPYFSTRPMAMGAPCLTVLARRQIEDLTDGVGHIASEAQEKISHVMSKLLRHQLGSDMQVAEGGFISMENLLTTTRMRNSIATIYDVYVLLRRQD